MGSEAAFAVSFVGRSFPVTDRVFKRVDPTHWVMDVASVVTPQYRDLKEVLLFLLRPVPELSDSSALGLYISLGGDGWQYRGFVSNLHPSEVMPLQWPEVGPSFILQPGAVQLGVSIEPQDDLMFKDNCLATAAELLQKEGSKLAGKQEYAKRVAMNLFRYMESFSTAGSSSQLVLPTNALEQWFNKFNDKFKRDPDFLIHEGEKG